MKKTRLKNNAIYFNKIRQYNIRQIDKIIFFKYKTRQIKATEKNKIYQNVICSNSHHKTLWMLKHEEYSLLLTIIIFTWYGNVLFNDTLNSLIWLYGVGHMVKDHLVNKTGNPLPPLHGLLFSISSKGSFICTIPHTTAFVTPVMEH